MTITKKQIKDKKLIDYIFSTEIEVLDAKELKTNKGLAALCLLYKYKHRSGFKELAKEIIDRFGANITLNNINVASVPDFLEEISKYVNITETNLEPSSIKGQGKAEKVETATFLEETQNTIFYGPPGTGKTHYIQTEILPQFKQPVYLKTKEEYEFELIYKLPWWQVIALVLLESPDLTVPQIKEHRFTKYKLMGSDTRSLNQTVWGQLSSHTVLESDTVDYASRGKRLIFNKKNEGSVWYIVDTKKSEIQDLCDILEDLNSYVATTENKGNYKFITFHQSYSYEDFIEGIKPIVSEGKIEDPSDLGYCVEKGVFYEACEEACKLAGFLSLKDCIESTREVRKEKFSTSAQYALFIDEVNRGNISAIFGELITLIEYDKRLGRKNEIIIELPYSKSKFSVPPNLAIYGTMNTADRSITLLDSALRRRFQFFEIRPNPSLLNPISFHDSGEVSLSSLLMKINDRITYFLGKDQCIGHSYFLQLKDSVSPERDLLKVFMSNVIPLLEEYFYNDIHKIRMVLGETSENPANNFYEEDLPLQLSSLFNGSSVNEEIEEMPIAYKLNAKWVNALDKSSGISIPAALFTKIYA